MPSSTFGRTWLRALASVVTFVAVGQASSGASAQQCIQAKSKEAVTACPASAAKPKSKEGKGLRPTGAPKASPKSDKPFKPIEIDVNEGRGKTMTKKTMQLIVAEIQTLETLFTDTKKSSADRPKLARRLAEAYVELEGASFRNKIESQLRAEKATKQKKPDDAKKERESATKADGVLKSARKSAIKYYTLLKGEYPKFCLHPNAQNPTASTGCGDEVLYFLAYEHEGAKDLEAARKTYAELLEKHKTSQYRPQAYFAFGELFFTEAQGDPNKWSFAQGAYEEALKSPAPGNRIFGQALYKLAYVHWNQGEHEKAADGFKKTIEFAAQHSTVPGASSIASAARRDIIPVYAAWGDAKKAFSFFKPLSRDKAGENEDTFTMLDSLGMAYLDTGHYDEGLALYGDLMNRDKGARWCQYHARISDATIAKRSADKDAIFKVLSRQLEVEKEFSAAGHAKEAKDKCGNSTAALLTETAMAWHLEAMGSGGVRGTGDEKTMKLAAQLYDKTVERFTADEFAAFKFPRLVKEDWPTLPKIRYLMADLLFFQKDWEKCGPAFDAVHDADPKGPTAAEAAFGAAKCWENLYATRHKDGADRRGLGTLAPATESLAQKLAPKPLGEAQKGMLRSFQRYVCNVTPDATDKDAVERLVSIKYARAYTYFEARNWEEAAVAFRAVAMDHPKHELGVHAAQLYLESLNVLATHFGPERSSCRSSMTEDIPKLVELYCGEGKSGGAEQCNVLNRVQRDSLWAEAEDLVKEADKNPSIPESLEKYRKAAGLYVSIWEKFGKEPCEKGEKERCARSDEVLYNASKAFQAARLLAKSIAIKKVLTNPKYNLHETKSARSAIYEIGANYQAIAVYDEAAAHYERFATENGKDERAPQALSDAVVLRLGLGQKDLAIKDAELFQKSFASRKAQGAQIAFAVGAHYAEKSEWAAARKHLERDIGSIDKNATPDVRIQAHAVLGRAHAKTGSSTRARQEYDKVRSSWKDATAAMDQIRKATSDDDGVAVERRVAKTLEAVGEAHFFFAEEKRAIVEKLAFPQYKGSGEKKDVEKFVNTKVADWQKKKRAAIEEADLAYQAVLKLEPEPPPRWVIAAGSRVGLMKGKFVAEFRAAPIPKEWEQNGPSPYGDLLFEEIRGAYYAELDRVSEPDKLAAKGAYEDCLKRSVKFQYFDENSRTCEQWLSKMYPADYHLIDEFRTSPNRIGSGLNERAVPLHMDGSPVLAQIEPVATKRAPAPATKVQ